MPDLLINRYNIRFMADQKGPKGPKKDIQWIIQVDGARQVGPISTQEVLQRITEGALTGEERIKSYPDGSWTKISKEPQFYDKLLEVLENIVKKNVPKSRSATPPVGPSSQPPAVVEYEKKPVQSEVINPEIEIEDPDRTVARPRAEVTVQDETKARIVDEDATRPVVRIINENVPAKILNSDTGAQTRSEILAEDHEGTVYSRPQDFSHFPVVKEENAVVPFPVASSDGKLTPVAAKSQIINLQNIKDRIQEEKAKSTFVPMVMIIIAATLAAIAYLWPEETIDRGHLLAPKVTNQNKLSDEDQKKLLGSAVAKFFEDTYEGHIQAQSKLIDLIEGAPKNASARGMICLVYKELWPHVKQDSNDYKIFMSAEKAAKALDPIGENGLMCDVSYLMINGKYKEAKGAIEYAFEQKSFGELAPLYATKAEILAADKDFKSAAAWSKSAEQFWPKWVKPYLNEAEYQTEMGQSQAAVEILNRILKLNPNHRSAQIELGAALVKLNQTEEALNYLGSALASQQKVTRKQSAKLHFNLAKAYEKLKQNGKAIEHLQSAYRLTPGDTQIKNMLLQMGASPSTNIKNVENNELLFLGDQYARSGDCLSAQAEYKAAFEIDPTNALAAVKAAKCLWKLNQAFEATVWLQKATKSDPKMALAYYLLADYYSQRFQFNLANDNLNLGAKRVGQNPEIIRGFGLLEFRRNNSKGAIQYLERAKKYFENDIETMVLLAKAYALDGDFTKSQQIAAAAIGIEPTNTEAQMTYAKMLSQFKGTDQAVYYVKELISKYTYTSEYKITLAEILRDGDRFRQAQEIYEQVSLMDPKNKKAFIGLGDVLQAQGHLDKALKAFLDAGVLDPTDAEPIFRAGVVFLESGRAKDAITQFKRGIDLNPYYPRGHFLMGKAYFSVQDYKSAIAEAAEEKKNNPKLADPYNLAGDSYRRMRAYSNCANEYQQAVKLRPKGAEMYVKLASCHTDAGNLDIAESMLTLAVQQENGYAEIYREQGRIFERRGEARPAAQAYLKYLDLSPNAPDKSEIEGKIARFGGGN